MSDNYDLILAMLKRQTCLKERNLEVELILKVSDLIRNTEYQGDYSVKNKDLAIITLTEIWSIWMNREIEKEHVTLEVLADEISHAYSIRDQHYSLKNAWLLLYDEAPWVFFSLCSCLGVGLEELS